MPFPPQGYGVAVGIEEETYNTWNHVWTRDYGAGVQLMCLNVDDDGRVYVSDVLNMVAYLKDYAGVETNTPNYWYLNLTAEPGTGLGPSRSFSRTEKYILGSTIPPPITSIDVWREGVNVVTINIALVLADAAGIWDVQISHNGKFIAFIITSTATGNNRYLILYEGV